MKQNYNNWNHFQACIKLILSTMLALCLFACGGEYSGLQNGTTTTPDSSNNDSASNPDVTEADPDLPQETDDPVTILSSGEHIYATECASCHGDAASVTSLSISTILESSFAAPTLDALLSKNKWVELISQHSPINSGFTCSGQCATDVATYIHDTFVEPKHFPNAAADIYNQQCAACHGVDGSKGGLSTRLTELVCMGCSKLDGLAKYIEMTMPTGDASACGESCAKETAKYIFAGFKQVPYEDDLYVSTQIDTPVTDGNETPPTETPPTDPAPEDQTPTQPSEGDGSMQPNSNVAPSVNIQLNQTAGKTPFPLLLDGRGSSDSDGSITEYRWQITRNGQEVFGFTGSTGVQNLTEGGDYQITLMVTDNEGLSSTASTTLSITAANDCQPIADYFNQHAWPVMEDQCTICHSENQQAGNTLLVLNGGNREDSWAVVQNYGLDDQGSAMGFDLILNKPFSESSMDHGGGKLFDAGSFEYYALANLRNLFSHYEECQLAANQPPVGTINSDYVSGPAPLQIVLDGSNSYDPEGGTLTYFWDLGDGNQSNNSTLSHTYNEGQFTIQLTVTDSAGKSTTQALNITVLPAATPNQPPKAVADATAPIAVEVGDIIMFDGTLSTDDVGITSYQWDLGNNVTRTGVTFSYAYPVAGTYFAQLTVMDEEGAQSSDTVTITVVEPNHPPTANVVVNDSNGTVPFVAYLIADANDPDNDVLTYRWQVGGQSSTSKEWAVNFTEPGTYNAQLTVTDGEGASATASTTITVNDPQSCVTTEEYFTVNSWPVINNYVDSKGRNLSCTGCHREGGQYTQDDLLMAPDDASFSFDAIKQYVTSGQGERLINKAMGVPSHRGGAIHLAGSYGNYILENLVQKIENPVSCDPNDEIPTGNPGGDETPTTGGFWDGVTFLSPQQTLRKATLLFAGRAPTDNELAQVNESNLDQMIRGVMSGAAFEAFIRESTNDQLWTDKYASRYDTSLFRQVADDWGFDRSALESETQRAMNKQLAREPLQRMIHIVMNERPYSEFITGDYMLVTPLIDDLFTFVEPPRYQDASNNEEWAEAKLKTPVRYDRDDVLIFSGTDYPHAGVLTSPAWLKRFPSTSTNRNRHRARYAMIQFLGFDIESLISRSTNPDSLMDTDSPTYKNPDCTGCHNIMDPVAATFMNFYDEGQYRPRSIRDYPLTALPGSYEYSRMFQPGDLWFRHDYDIEGVNYRGLDTIGFNGVELPITEGLTQAEDDNHHRSLSWLAQQFVSDSRFAEAAVKFWYPAVFSQDMLDEPSDANSPDYQWQQVVYAAQQASLSEWANAFSNDQGNGSLNVKDLLVTMATSNWFRAAAVTTDRDPSTLDQLNTVGLERLLTPEQLNRKLKALTGFYWTNYSGSSDYLGEYGTYTIPYGGQDSDENVKRVRTMDSLKVAMMQRMAIQVSCGATLIDFDKPQSQRLLFKYLEATDLPDNGSGTAAIRNNIQYLYEYLLGQTVTIDSEEVNLVYDLFLDLKTEAETQRGSTARCEMHSSELVPRPDDPNYTIRTWAMVMAFFLSDFHFLYD